MTRTRHVGRRALALLTAVAAPLAADTYPRQPGIDVQHYSFHLELGDETDSITGEATIDLRLLADDVGAITLDLVDPAAAKPGHGMTVLGVRENEADLRFRHAQGRLHVEWPARHAGDHRRVVVRYRGVPETGLLIAPNKHGDRTFFSDNWPNKARHWLPVVDHPYDKATSEMEVVAPAHYQVVSNGVLIEETDLGAGRRRTRWRQSVPIASWLYAVGVARFAVEHRGDWRGRPIETWVFAQDRDAGFRVFSEPTRAALDFFEDRIGPYPYERLAHVQANGVRGGMEVATSIFYGADAVTDPPTPRWRNVMVHEIAHQWWGNSVTESDWDDVWLSEGFATYFTHLFVEHARGRDAFVTGLRADREAIREFDRKQPDYRVIHDQLADMSQVLSGPGTYRKGGWTLHMLRGVVGDAAFWQGIREHYRRHRDGHATTADFRRVMEEASGLELSWFFDQWLTRGGMLNVRARWNHDPNAGVLRLQLEQLQAGAPYRMPIEVALAGEGEPRVETIDLRERRQDFSFPLAARPGAVVLDPRDLVLMDADVAEEPDRP